MRNIDRFDLYALHVLSMLYESFPVGIRLDVAGIANAVGLPRETGEKEHAQNEVVRATIDWLLKTGYLLHFDESDQRDRRLYRYVLSPKAFEALKAPAPKSLQKKSEPEKSVGEKAVEAAGELAKDVRKESSKHIAAEIVGTVIGHAARALGGSG